MVNPAFTENNIPIAFSSDNDYSKYLGVTIQSIIKNSSETKNYDILIIDSKISEINKSKIKSLIQNKSNFSIRFFQVEEHLQVLDESIFYLEKNSRVTASTYYRFLIPVLFKNYKKIIYLDCDLVVLSDIGCLYHIDIGNNIIGAVKDYSINLLRFAHKQKYIDYKGNPTLDYEKYIKEKLGLPNPERYFNCGVLVCNVAMMIENKFLDSCVAKLGELKKPIYWDQCVLNSLYHEKVKYIDLEWNLTVCTITFEKAFIKLLPLNLSEKLYYGYRNPKIIHYAAEGKPWKFGPHNGELAHSWWYYAIMTPFYDDLIQPIKKSQTKNKKKPHEVDYKNKKIKVKIFGITVLKIFKDAKTTRGKMFGVLPIFDIKNLK